MIASMKKVTTATPNNKDVMKLTLSPKSRLKPAPRRIPTVAIMDAIAWNACAMNKSFCAKVNGCG